MSGDTRGIEEYVLQAIAVAADLPRERITADLDLLEMGLDSMDFWRILMDVEDGLGVEVPADVIDRLTQLVEKVTVGHLLQVLAAWDGASEAAPRPQDQVLVIEPE